jgi:4-amino-4-deoxy-L-arabinose transferase-like glycosyltransferase
VQQGSPGTTGVSPVPTRAQGSPSGIGETPVVSGVSIRYADWLLLAGVILIALYQRITFTSLVPPFISKDSQSYFLPAWDLVHGGGLVLGLRRTPGYPLFLAFIQSLFGSELSTVVLVQHLIGVGTAALAFVLGRLIYGRLAGAVAGLLVALSAPLIVYEHYVLTEALFMFAITAAMLLLVLAMRSKRTYQAFIAGVSLGLASMVRPVGQVLAPVLLLGIAASRWPRWREAIVATVVCSLGLVIALTPWAVRNQLVNDLGGTTTFGRTLIARTAYYDRGFVFYEPGWGDVGDAQSVAARKVVQEGANRRQSDGTIAGRLRQDLNLGPVEVNAVMRDVATEAIVRRPGHFLVGSLKFAWTIFQGQDERVGNHADEVKDVTWEARTAHLLPGKPSPSQDLAQRDAQRLLNLFQPARYTFWLTTLFILGMVGSALRSSWRSGLVVASAAVAHIVLSAALDGPQERYRYTVDPLINVMAAGGIATCAAFAMALRRSVSSIRPTPTRQPDVAPTR